MNTGRWWVLSVPGGELAGEMLGETLMDHGAIGMNEIDSRLLVTFPERVDREAVRAAMQPAVLALQEESLLPAGELTTDDVEDEDWVGRWRRSLGPIRAGEHFLIVPPGVEAEPRPTDHVLAIEPRMAFGTGEHATTRQALAAMEQLPLTSASVLDLGCGNGILAIGALLAGAGHVTAVDFELESVEETADNASRHGLSDRIEVVKADVLDWRPGSEPFDILLVNIYITPILAGIDRWVRWLSPEGHAVFTGLKEGDEQAELHRAMDRAGLERLGQSAMDTWVCAWGRKR